jgi:hypothetical protein
MGPGNVYAVEENPEKSSALPEEMEWAHPQGQLSSGLGQGSTEII